ncbi:MAG: hypothetical protein V1777_01930 [Candidatus Micrarchaeota archaeon]
MGASAWADPRAHNATVTISPGIANCSQLGNDFNVTIANAADSPDNIFEVRIYKSVAGLSDFSCGPAPTGWQLFDFTETYGYCEYKEVPGEPNNKIHPGESLDFSFTATMSSNACASVFQISTLDDAQPIGEHEFNYPQVLIDCTDPVLQKTVGQPNQLIDPNCDPNTTTCDYWVSQQTQIGFSATDHQDQCDLGIDYCDWTITLDGQPLNSGTEENGPDLNFGFQFSEDSHHVIAVTCYDRARNSVSLTELDKVDGTPPETVKTYGTPFYTDGLREWVSTTTPISLSATDPDPTTFSCNIGVESTWYRIIPVPDYRCQDPATYCLDYPEDDNGGKGWPYIEYTGTPFSIPQESCHYIDFYSEDFLGNREPIMKPGPEYGTGNWQCAFVDATPPVVSKQHGEPAIQDFDQNFVSPGNPEGEFHWVTPDTNITFTCRDPDPHPSGHEELVFKVSYDLADDGYVTEEYCQKYSGAMENNWCVVSATPQYPLVFNFNENEDSVHDLEYYCQDAVEKKSDVHKQWYKVDSTPPSITKEMFGSYLGDCPPQPDSNDQCYVADNGTSGVSITVDDGGPICAVDQIVCTFEVWWQASEEECNEANGQYNDNWCLVNSGEFSDNQEDIIFSEDSTHRLDVSCHDNLGNETTESEIFLVDSTPPETTKAYGDPHYPEPIIEEQYPHWISTSTPITLTAIDEKVGVNKTYWRNTLVDNSYCESVQNCVTSCSDEYITNGGFETGDTNGWATSDGHVYATTEAAHSGNYGVYFEPIGNCHDDYIYQQVSIPACATDAKLSFWLNASSFDSGFDYIAIYFGGNLLMQQWSPPWQWTYYEFDVGSYAGSIEQLELRFVKSETTDCIVGSQLKIDDISIKSDGGSGGMDWNEYTGPFTKDEESCHLIEYYSDDLLGNTEPVNWQCTFIDNSAPQGQKEVGQPSIACEEGQTCDYYVTQQTPIHLSCNDVEPHPVDHAIVHWRTALWQDENWQYGEWQLNSDSAEVRFGEDSRHLLEFYCTDALGNTGETDVEEFFVETVPPVTTKTYLGPYYTKEVCGDFNGDDDSDDDGGDECQTQEYIDTASRIDLNAIDPAPHPSGVNTTYYRTNLVPNEYCEQPETYCQPCGTDKSDCGEFQEYSKPFGINQESCHVIEFYSTDNLSNTEELNYQCAFVDKTPPVTNKEFGKPYFSCYNSCQAECETSPGKSECVDQCVQAQCQQDQSGHWIPQWGTTQTAVTLSAYDPEPHPSDVNATYRRITRVNDEACQNVEACNQTTGSGEFSTYDGAFTAQEQSCHLIEYYSVDNVQKTEVVKKECIFIDETPPTPTKTVGEPSEPWNGQDSIFYPGIGKQCWNGDANQLECWKVTLLTPITMECADQQPHPVDHGTLSFKVELDAQDDTSHYCTAYNGQFNVETGWCQVNRNQIQFFFLEETEHNLKFYCEDALGNISSIDDEKFKVEGTAFKINLNRKWNLISVPFVLQNDDPANVFESADENIDGVWNYDAFTNQWYVFRPSDPGASNLDSIIPGNGYWVSALNPAIITLGGSLFSPQTVPPEKPIKGNSWNLVGYFGTESTYATGDDLTYDGPDQEGREAYCVFASLVDDMFDIPFSSLLTYWEPNNPHQWMPFSFFDNMDPGAGYWVYANQDDTENYVYTTTCNGIIPIAP